jgi:hypothetical protein
MHGTSPHSTLTPNKSRARTKASKCNSARHLARRELADPDARLEMPSPEFSVRRTVVLAHGDAAAAGGSPCSALTHLNLGLNQIGEALGGWAELSSHPSRVSAHAPGSREEPVARTRGRHACQRHRPVCVTDPLGSELQQDGRASGGEADRPAEALREAGLPQAPRESNRGRRAGLVAASDALAWSTSLTHLDMADNQLGDTGSTSLQTLFHKSTCLLRLNLDGCSVLVGGKLRRRV